MDGSASTSTDPLAEGSERTTPGELLLPEDQFDLKRAYCRVRYWFRERGWHGVPHEVLEDLAQDALLKAWEKYDAARGSSWWGRMGVATMWVTFDYIKKLTRREGDGAPHSNGRLIDLAESRELPPDALTEFNETWAQIVEVLEDLPGIQKDIFLALYYEGLTPREVADRVGTSLAMVYKHAYQVRKALRERLELEP